MPTCNRCRFGIPNTGIVIPVSERDWFCGRLEAVADPATRDILDSILNDLRKQGACPAAQPFSAPADAYLSQDLSGREMKGSLFRQVIADANDPDATS